MTNQMTVQTDRPKLVVGRTRADGLMAHAHMTSPLQTKIVSARRLFDEAEHLMNNPGAATAVYGRAIDEKITWANSILTIVDEALDGD
jgi:hypothetical protein